MSLMERQKEKYWGRICEARQDLAQFEESLVALVGTEVAESVRQHIHPPWRSLLQGGSMPEVPVEGQEALAEAQRLVKQENRITRHLHSPICCYMERLEPPYVVWTYGASWDDIECQRDENGKVTLDYALRLLHVLLTEKPRVMPSKWEIKAFSLAPEALEGWDKIFWRNRRRLVRFLQTAARLEEDLLWGIF